MSIISRFISVAKKEGINEAVYRAFQYVKGKTYSKLNAIKYMHLPSQIELLSEILKEEKITLIILDACRYDFFKNIYTSYLSGELKAVKSPAPWTGDWLKVVFGRFGTLLERFKIFSANPMLNSRNVSAYGFKARRYISGKNVIDIWDRGWDWELNTVHPKKVVEIVERERLGDKNIIWFIQPHFPYIGETRFLMPKEVIMCQKDTPSIWLSKKVRSGEISKDFLIQAYLDNLKLVLSSVKQILNLIDVEARVVITSDHGELLGECGYFFHPSFLRMPEQIIIPWLEVDIG